MAELPAYHWRTHLPGGTDEIPMPSLKWALAYGNDDMADAGTTYPFTFLELYSNDSTAFAAEIQSTVFKWIRINNPGYYRMSVSAIHNTSVFDVSTNDLRLDCSFQEGGLVSSITQNMGVADYVGVRFTDADALITGHEEPGGLFTQIAFNWDPDNPNSDLDAENPLLVGAMISQAGGPASIPINTRIFLERLTDPGYVTLYP
jgi:hypothetical protein